jgi:hypothetical protein
MIILNSIAALLDKMRAIGVLAVRKTAASTYARVPIEKEKQYWLNIKGL